MKTTSLEKIILHRSFDIPRHSEAFNSLSQMKKVLYHLLRRKTHNKFLMKSHFFCGMRTFLRPKLFIIPTGNIILFLSVYFASSVQIIFYKKCGSSLMPTNKKKRNSHCILFMEQKYAVPFHNSVNGGACNTQGICCTSDGTIWMGIKICQNIY